MTVDTVRCYERVDVLPSPARTESGYRNYEPETVERIRLTRELQAIGFTLNEAVDALAAHDAASAERAAIIVIGHGHRQHLTRVLHGTARQLLQRTPSPIAVAPVGFAQRAVQPIRRIGVGYEPTPEGEAALTVAHRLAAMAGGELRAIGVVLPLAPLALDEPRDPEPYLADERRVVQAGLERAVAALPRRSRRRAVDGCGFPRIGSDDFRQ